MRIAIGQLWQESNTLNPVPTTLADFEAMGIYEGAELVQRFAETNELGGFIQSLRAWPEAPEIVGLMRFGAWPGGVAKDAVFTRIMDGMMDALHRQGPVDAVLLALHGSMVAENEPDVEGHLLQRMRQHVGPKIPIVATLDLHANVTQRMVDMTDVLVLYHTSPHIDILNTGKRGAAALRRILFHGAKPVTSFRKLPLVVPAECANTQDPASFSYQIRKVLEGWERNSFVLEHGLASVQPWMDIPDLGSAVVVVCDGEARRSWAEQSSASMAREVWDHRRDFLPELTEIADAVRAAHAAPEGLTVISDSADATTAGSTGDSTALLKELIRYDWPRPALVPLVGPELVAEAQKRGIGTDCSLSVGATRNPRDFEPLTLPVRVANLFDARFILTGHLGNNLPIDMGASAVLQHGNVRIVVTSRTGPHFAPQFFQSAGLDPFAASVLIAKSPIGFRAAYAERSKQIFVVPRAGLCAGGFLELPLHPDSASDLALGCGHAIRLAAHAIQWPITACQFRETRTYSLATIGANAIV